jgi:hypothetical protein
VRRFAPFPAHFFDLFDRDISERLPFLKRPCKKRDYIRWRFADRATADLFEKEFA